MVFTPYLMLGDDLMDAMISAAQRGVDVIIMLGIPDKKLIFRMSRSFLSGVADWRHQDL